MASGARNDTSANDITNVIRKAETHQNRTHQGSSEKGFPISDGASADGASMISVKRTNWWIVGPALFYIFTYWMLCVSCVFFQKMICF